jgi:hypothetical protein
MKLYACGLKNKVGYWPCLYCSLPDGAIFFRPATILGLLAAIQIMQMLKAY